MSAPVCPYCNGRPVLVDTAEFYNGRSYGLAWLCRPCDARVGCHRGTHTPLGTLANAELRAARSRAHYAFDPLWKANPRTYRRTGAYRRLAEHLGIPFEACHIALFGVAQCERVVLWARAQPRALEVPDAVTR